MSDDSDPRVFFAAERTLLAWVRTGLATIGLGFVVARFGLFLRMVRNDPDASARPGSTLIGVGLVLLGAAAIGMAARQHVQFCRSLPPGSIPRPSSLRWSVAFAVTIAAISAVLGAYLLMQPNMGSRAVGHRGSSTCPNAMSYPSRS